MIVARASRSKFTMPWPISRGEEAGRALGLRMMVVRKTQRAENRRRRSPISRAAATGCCSLSASASLPHPTVSRSSRFRLAMRSDELIRIAHNRRRTGGLMSYGANVADAVSAGRRNAAASSGASNQPNCRSAADQVRTRDQPQDRQGARPHRAAELFARADEVIE